MNNKKYKYIQKGFSLLEMVIVIALIGIAMAIVMPSRKKSDRKIVPLFTQNLNTLLRKAYLSALEHTQAQKIYFDIKRGRVEVQQETDKKEWITHNSLFVSIPQQIEFRNFYIATKQGKKDQLRQETNDVWFFITSDGIAQEVVLNIVDITEKAAIPEAGLVLNPITLIFNVHDEFKKL